VELLDGGTARRPEAEILTCAEPLLENINPGAVIADKAYDADRLIDKLTQRRVTPVIPPKANRKDTRECDFALYYERNLIERFFNKIKHFRGIATRYDKLARNYLAAVQLVAVTARTAPQTPGRAADTAQAASGLMSTA
jgi:putative transposase